MDGTTIVVFSFLGYKTTNMFANTNINFADLIQWKEKLPCNTCIGLTRLKITDEKPPNVSKKMLQSKMIKLRKQIYYQNSSRQNLYNIIYSNKFYDIVKLFKNCKSSYYKSLLQTILRSDSVSNQQKDSIREFISRTIIL